MYFIYLILWVIFLFSIFSINIVNNWLVLWLMLELNTTMFLIVVYKNSIFYKKMEFIMKYFLIQSITSVILVVLCSIYFNLFFFVMIILLKMGIPPFHLWVLDILKMETQWNNFFILMTFQKYYLFLLISTKMQQVITFMTLLFAFVVFFSILNLMFNNKMMCIMFFSSSVHSVWMMISLMMSLKIFLLYFTIYTSTMKMLTFLMNDNNVITTYNVNNMVLWWIFWVFMGFPPFSIFVMKWSILIFVMKWSIPTFMILILMSFVMLYIYMKFIMMNLSMKFVMNLKKFFIKKMYFFILTETMLLSFVLMC